MSKLVGFKKMTKKEGVVLFLTNEPVVGSGTVGLETSVEFFFGDGSNKINVSSIGKNVELVFTKGFNGKAVLSDVLVK